MCVRRLCRNRRVAQRSEHWSARPSVAGSSPAMPFLCIKWFVVSIFFEVHQMEVTWIFYEILFDDQDIPRDRMLRACVFRSSWGLGPFHL